ncbi:MAG: hypothetical protein JW754_02675 [Candidatus Aenigmarchaeota archaeon]|nr:hypothetical protein [Candidatus Aenigmarchaeota archaeon]
MEYERPRLAFFMGSRGGHRAFYESVDGYLKRLKSKGSVYFLEHIPHSHDSSALGRRFAKNLTKNHAREGTVLEGKKLFYNCHDVTVHELSRGETNIYVPLKSNGNIVFSRKYVNTEPADMRQEFNYSIRSLLDCGYGEDMVLIILSGNGDDGSFALGMAKERGAKVIIQDPETASNPKIPENAIETGHYDFILKPGEISKKVLELFE